MRIFGLFHRCCGATRIARVARFNIGQNMSQTKAFVLGDEFFPAPLGTHLRARGNKQFGIGVRADNRADIATI